MIPRRLEPEVMDTAEEAIDYNTMDHSGVNRLFVDDLLTLLNSTTLNDGQEQLRFLDVGTGTALIPLELCSRSLEFQITAIDLAAEMLKVAEENVERAGCAANITLQKVDAKGLPYEDGAFPVVMSNSIIHHIPEPLSCLREMWRVLKPGGILFVRDLLRPSNLETLEQLVKTYAGEENAHSQQMFRDSLHAALTLAELHTMLEEIGIPRSSATETTDRHWTIACVKSDSA